MIQTPAPGAVRSEFITGVNNKVISTSKNLDTKIVSWSITLLLTGNETNRFIK